MLKKYIKTNTLKQIKKLKKDLMKRTYSLSHTHSDLSSSVKIPHTISNRSKSTKISLEFNKIKNAEIGEIFETNIRETLMFEYNFKPGDIERHFFARKLTFEGKEEILLIEQPKDVMINNEKYLFLFNNDKSITVKKDSKQIFPKIMTNKKTNLSIDGENVEIGKLTEIEVDGSFNFDGSGFGFNKEEVNILFTNVNNTQMSSYNYIILEIKLSKTKIQELIGQLLKDKQIMEKIYNKKFLYVGFINSKNIDIDISSIIGDLNLIIFGLKKNVFASRDMRRFYDWDIIHNVKLLNSEVSEIKKQIGEIKNQIGGMNNQIEFIVQQISLLLENKTINEERKKQMNLLGRKKWREKIDDEENDGSQKK